MKKISTGVSYDGDLKCDGEVVTATSPSKNHLPLLTLSAESTATAGNWEVKLGQNLDVNLHVPYLERILGVVRSLTGPTTAATTGNTWIETCTPLNL